jgi:hypothetical protein
MHFKIPILFFGMRQKAAQPYFEMIYWVSDGKEKPLPSPSGESQQGSVRKQYHPMGVPCLNLP